MANKIILKKSSVAAKVPTTSDLVHGELALNYTDGKLYYKTATDTIASISSSGSSLWTKKTSNYTAAAGDKIIADTSAGPFTITLPSSPVTGNSVVVADGANWQTTNLSVARNGSTIEGLAEDLILNIPNIQVEFVYGGTTWEVYAFTGPSGVDVSDDTTTNASVYPTWVSANNGNQAAKVSSSKLYFNPSTGQLNSTDFNSLSDVRKKKDVHTITDAVNVVSQLRGVSFKWIENDRNSMGVIAQEIEQILPSVVSTSEDGEKSVSYSNIVAVLIEAIKEQQREINTIKQRLEN